MTIDELKKILVKEKVNPFHYSVTDSTFIKATEGFLIRMAMNESWQLIFEERGEQQVEGEFDNEHDVCLAFLKEMAYDYKQLKKYLPQDEPK